MILFHVTTGEKIKLGFGESDFGFDGRDNNLEIVPAFFSST
jgi:hypothetical protein